MNSGKTRSSLFAVVGAYLLYIVWELYQGWNDPNTTMPHAVMALFIVLFAVIACVLLVYAWRVWKNAAKEEEEEKKKQQDESSFK
jgi:branched-subunit amino acid ABC-type transport system permease component